MKNKHNNWLIIITLALFALNFTPVFAQVMEIEVIGAGYRLRGPDVIDFGSTPASFSASSSTKDIRSLHIQDEENLASTSALDYIAIEDQNGGNAFQVNVQATNLLDASSGLFISNSSFFIKNANGTGSDIVADNASTTITGVELDSSTAAFTDLSTQRVLFRTDTSDPINPSAPGAWRIYPVFRIDIPAKQPPGNYVATMTFTII